VTRREAKHAPAKRSVSSESGFQPTARDVGVVTAVGAEYRALTSYQIARLFFPSAGDAPSARCLLRLRLLSAARYLRRIEQPSLLSEGRKPFVYVLDRRGADMLADHSGLALEEIVELQGRGSDSGLPHPPACVQRRPSRRHAGSRRTGMVDRGVD
jgi:hypothetical protein